MANSNGWGDGAANNAIGWGQGANNAIAWGDSHAKSWAGATDIVGLTTDPDAQAFITAAAITDATQQLAIDNLVKGLKSDNIWTKMKAIYPFVGGTASTHKWNLKDPRDLDAAFRLVFNGGWTHSSTGAKGNGVNGYADTNLIPNTDLTFNNASFSGYSRNNITGFSIDQSFGCASASTYRPLIGCTILTTKAVEGLIYDYLPPDYMVSATGQNVAAMFITTRTSSSNSKLFRNTTQIASATTNNQTTQPTNKFFLGAFNGPSSIINYNTFEYAFAHIGDGLTDTEAANLYTRVQAYQTALSRQV
jgi:hypothetical protein